jgi:hypothetical protein
VNFGELSVSSRAGPVAEPVVRRVVVLLAVSGSGVVLVPSVRKASPSRIRKG